MSRTLLEIPYSLRIEETIARTSNTINTGTTTKKWTQHCRTVETSVAVEVEGETNRTRLADGKPISIDDEDILINDGMDLFFDKNERKAQVKAAKKEYLNAKEELNLLEAEAAARSGVAEEISGTITLKK